MVLNYSENNIMDCLQKVVGHWIVSSDNVS